MKSIYRTPIFCIQIALGLAMLVLAVATFALDLRHGGILVALTMAAMLIVDVMAGGGPQRELKLLAEIRRLRRGLRFYAQQEHIVLQGWDDPAEPGWLRPPSKEDMEADNLDLEALPWMAEDGGVARIILRGGKIEKENGELIARMDPKGRQDENGRTLIDCYKFSSFGDQYLILRATDGIYHFAELFGTDGEERPLRIQRERLTKRQLRELPEWQS